MSASPWILRSLSLLRHNHLKHCPYRAAKESERARAGCPSAILADVDIMSCAGLSSPSRVRGLHCAVLEGNDRAQVIIIGVIGAMWKLPM
jgi:hypothetical protein